VMPAHHARPEPHLIETRPATARHLERSGMSRTTPGLGDTSGYEIRMTGHLDERWSEWFEGMDLDHDPDGTTVIRCPAMDQAGLHGLLRTLRDLGLPLISVTRIEPDRAGELETTTNDIR
jgi:hypothetical protein